MRFSPIRLSASLLIAGTSLLTSFISSAHAGTWSGPTYHVGARTPASDTNTDAPGGGGSGGTTLQDGDALIAAGGSPVSGAIHATFTWIPAPNMTVTTDPPPANVYVLEHGQASWALSGTGTGTIRPKAHRFSGQDAVYWPSRGARVFLVQAAGGGTNPQDGWSDAPQTAADGKSCTASGYHVALYQPVTDNGVVTLITQDRALGASVTATGTDAPSTSWFYKARIITIEIHRNGVDVTAPEHPEQPVMVGERNNMEAVVSPLPADIGPITYQWDIPGDRIKDFTTTQGSPGNPNANPPIAATPYTGKKVELLAADLQTYNPHFYWYNGSFAGDSKEVSVVVTFDGKPITVKAEFKVYRPRRDSFTATWTTLKPPITQYSYATTNQQTGQPEAHFLVGLGATVGGAGYRGITWEGKVSTPDIATAPGSIGLSQLVTSRSETNTAGVGDVIYESTNALDSDDPDPMYHETVPISRGVCIISAQVKTAIM